MGSELENPNPDELVIEVEGDGNTVIVPPPDEPGDEEETEPIVIVEVEEETDKWETVKLDELSLTALEANRLSNQAVMESNQALMLLLQNQTVTENPPVVVVEELPSPSETPSLEETETLPPVEEKPGRKPRARSPQSLFRRRNK